jgi:uncharacterized membrane protein
MAMATEVELGEQNNANVSTGHAVAAALIVLFIIVGGALRVARASSRTILLDEMASWRVSQCTIEEVLSRCSQNVHPPLHYLSLKAWTCAFGDSMFSMRALSVLFGCASIPMAYLLIRDTSRFGNYSGRSVWYAGMIAAWLTAVNDLQVEAGSTARMYSMGVLLSLASSWFIINALQDKSVLWWWGYAFAATLFLYSHNYALFTVPAQVAAAIPHVIFSYKSQRRACLLRRPLIAVISCVALYAPWISSLHSQITEVKQGYWISDLSAESILKLFHHLVAGFASDATIFMAAFAFVFTLCATYAIARTKSVGIFFALLALVPLAGSVLVSGILGTAIVHVRYLVLSQPYLHCLLSCGIATMPGILRFVVVPVVVCGTLMGTARLLSEPVANDSMELAVRDFAGRTKATDVVLVPSAGDVNKFLYYAKRARIANLRVVWLDNTADSRHVPHLASLDSANVVSPSELERFSEAWEACYEKNAPPLMREHTFAIAEVRHYEGDPPFRLTLWRRTHALQISPSRSDSD